MAYQKIKGMMSDGKTSRFVQVDADGRLVLAPSVEGLWKAAYINKGGTTTGTVDLDNTYMYMRVIIPTIDAATIKVQVAEEPGGTYYDLAAATTSLGTHNYADTFNIGGYRYLKFVASAAQTTAGISIRCSGLGVM